jgi:hypothetical protein
MMLVDLDFQNLQKSAVEFQNNQFLFQNLQNLYVAGSWGLASLEDFYYLWD